MSTPKCPKCGKEIDNLRHEATAIEVFTFKIIAGVPKYTKIDIHSVRQFDYKCPKCRIPLFKDTEEAIKFLKGGGERE